MRIHTLGGEHPTRLLEVYTNRAPTNCTILAFIVVFNLLSIDFIFINLVQLWKCLRIFCIFACICWRIVTGFYNWTVKSVWASIGGGSSFAYDVYAETDWTMGCLVPRILPHTDSVSFKDLLSTIHAHILVTGIGVWRVCTPWYPAHGCCLSWTMIPGPKPHQLPLG